MPELGDQTSDNCAVPGHDCVTLVGAAIKVYAEREVEVVDEFGAFVAVTAME
jgi:hypothetical protein